MTFGFKILCSLFAIIFIVNKCGADSDETAIENADWNPIIQNHPLRSYSDNGTEIPVHLIREYIRYIEENGIDAFIRKYGKNGDQGGNNIATRLGRVKRSEHTSGLCTPLLATIEIVPEPKDPTIRYRPRCTRLEQCSGCCSHDKLICLPTEVEILSLQITKEKIHPGQDTPEVLGTEVWNAQRHLKCACECKILESDCGPNEKYNEVDCSCKEEFVGGHPHVTNN